MHTATNADLHIFYLLATSLPIRLWHHSTLHTGAPLGAWGCGVILIPI